MPDFITHYWIEWIFGLIVAGIGWWAKRYVRLEKENINRTKTEHETKMCEEVKKEIAKELKKVEEKSNNNDRKLSSDLEVLSNQIENLNNGILSIQGR